MLALEVQVEFAEILVKLRGKQATVSDLSQLLYLVRLYKKEMPHAHNNTDLSAYAALLDEEERRYMKARYHRIKLCREITDKIERMDNEDEKDVLMYRYIRLMKWEDICVKMGHSWQHTHRIHKKALENFKM